MKSASTKVAWPDFNSSEHELDTLTKLSQFYGAQPEIVLAGGGNTSCKIGDRLFIKPSGTALAAMTREGFVEMDRGALDELLSSTLDENPETREAQFQAAIAAARCHPEQGQRPSVEVLLHHLIPTTYVVHSHPTVVNTLTCCDNGKSLSGKIFGADVLWLPYIDPGFTLAQSLKHALADYTAEFGCVPRAILLANHGLIVAADDPDEIRSTTDQLLDQIGNRLGEDWLTTSLVAAGPTGDGAGAAEVEEALRNCHPGKAIAFDRSAVVESLVGSKGGKAAACAGPLTPDQIVYCGSFPLWFDAEAGANPNTLISRLSQAIADHTLSRRASPKIVLAANIGLFAIGDIQKQANLARDVYIDAIKVMAGAQRLGRINYLTDRQRRFIEDWEVEAYRRQVAAAALA